MNLCTAQYLSIRACKFRREVEGNQVVGLTWGPGDPYHPSLRWAPLLGHMLERQKMIGREFEEDAVLCFDKLVLGRSQSLDWCGGWVSISCCAIRSETQTLGVLQESVAEYNSMTETFGGWCCLCFALSRQ